MESLTTALASLSSRDVFLMEIAITVLLLLVLLARYKLWRIRRLHEAKAARAVYEQRLREVGFVPKAPRCRNTPCKPQPPAP